MSCGGLWPTTNQTCRLALARAKVAELEALSQLQLGRIPFHRHLGCGRGFDLNIYLGFSLEISASGWSLS